MIDDHGDDAGDDDDDRQERDEEGGKLVSAVDGAFRHS